MNASWLAAQGKLPLAFMGLALVWLVIATAMTAFAPSLLAISHIAPPVVALTHAWALGFFVTVAIGAMYQIAPVALGTTLANERYGWWHFGLHAAGVPGMVVSFWRWDMTSVGHFGSAVALGIVLFAFNTWGTVRRSGQRDPVAWSLALAAGWLLATAMAGLLLAANRHWYFLRLDPIALLRAHAHLGLIGFFVTLLQGVTFRLVAMFTLADVPNWRPVRLGLWFSQLGLLGLAPSLAWQAHALCVVFGFSILIGLIFSAVALKQTLATRKKRFLDPGVRAFLRGGAVLLAAAVAGLALAWPKSPWGSAPGGFSAMIYAVAVFAGALLPTIAGMMCKVVPFLTWMRAYGPRVGRQPTPAAGALTRPKLETAALTLQMIAVLPLLIGAWTLNATWLRAGAWTLALGVALFVADMIGVFSHLWKPVTGAPTPRPTTTLS